MPSSLQWSEGCSKDGWTCSKGVGGTLATFSPGFNKGDAGRGMVARRMSSHPWVLTGPHCVPPRFPTHRDCRCSSCTWKLSLSSVCSSSDRCSFRVWLWASSSCGMGWGCQQLWRQQCCSLLPPPPAQASSPHLQLGPAPSSAPPLSGGASLPRPRAAPHGGWHGPARPSSPDIASSAWRGCASGQPAPAVGMGSRAKWVRATPTARCPLCPPQGSLPPPHHMTEELMKQRQGHHHLLDEVW